LRRTATANDRCQYQISGRRPHGEEFGVGGASVFEAVRDHRLEVERVTLAQHFMSTAHPKLDRALPADEQDFPAEAQRLPAAASRRNLGQICLHLGLAESFRDILNPDARTGRQEFSGIGANYPDIDRTVFLTEHLAGSQAQSLDDLNKNLDRRNQPARFDFLDCARRHPSFLGEFAKRQSAFQASSFQAFAETG
jgi:hypothetical protein